MGVNYIRLESFNIRCQKTRYRKRNRKIRTIEMLYRRKTDHVPLILRHVLVNRRNYNDPVAPAVSRVNPAGVNVVNPGSFVKAKILQPQSPIAYGYKETTHVFTGVGPILNTSFKDRKYIVMQYGTSVAKDFPEENKKDENICLSGMVKDAEQMIQSPAILNVPRQNGQIVIFSFNPMHRYLNHHDFGFLFNTILHWNDL